MTSVIHHLRESSNQVSTTIEVEFKVSIDQAGDMFVGDSLYLAKIVKKLGGRPKLLETDKGNSDVPEDGKDISSKHED